MAISSLNCPKCKCAMMGRSNLSLLMEPDKRSLALFFILVTAAFLWLLERHAHAEQTLPPPECRTLFVEEGQKSSSASNGCPTRYAALAELATANYRGDPSSTRVLVKAAADDGNLNYQILYTLAFTGIFDSPFLNETARRASYSNVIRYFGALRMIREIGSSSDCGLIIILSNNAIADGLEEAHLGVAICNLLNFKQSKDAAYRKDYIAAMLRIAVLLSVTDEAIAKMVVSFPELRESEIQVLAMHAEMEMFDNRSTQCRAVKASEFADCVLGSGIRRLACKVRDDKGELLLELSPKQCNAVLTRIVPVYVETLRQRTRDVLSLRP